MTAMATASISDEIRQFWDDDAATYDNSASHHPRRLHERAAWSATLRRLLPDPPARVLDVGAGTGFLSLLLAAQGFQVTAVDLSPGMLGMLRSKAERQGLEVRTVQSDAVSPPDGPFDAVVERHLLWTLPDPGAALAAWRHAVPAGRLVLLEGTWGKTGGIVGLQQEARALARRIRGAETGHHDHYTDRVVRALPHVNGLRPADVVALVQAGPWGQARLERLRDVEWAELEGRSLIDQLLGTSPRWAVTAGS
jgi:SAM-dependent methyltransferase